MATSNKDIISALKHGDFEILNGVVSFIAKDPEQQQPASKWLAERRNEIENYIIRALKLENAYRYVDYSTGSYGPKSLMVSRLRLTTYTVETMHSVYLTPTSDINAERELAKNYLRKSIR